MDDYDQFNPMALMNRVDGIYHQLFIPPTLIMFFTHHHIMTNGKIIPTH